MKTFIYSISFSAPLENKEAVEKLLQESPTLTYDCDIDEEDGAALFNAYSTFVNKNSQKSEEEQSIEEFTNLIEKLKNS